MLTVQQAYKKLVKKLEGQHNKKEAMSLSVGGNFDAIGILERELLIQHGLMKDGYLIDVGCGSGRLAQALPEYLAGRYLGVDIVPDLVDHARSLADRPDWRFEVSDGLKIPAEENDADIVCFFSVFTHLLHEHSFEYLREAKRVLKPGGKIIFSFLEFQIPDLWQVFESTLTNASEEHPLAMFMSREAIEVWSHHLGLEVVSILDGNKPHIPLPHPVTFDDGTTIEGKGKLGPIGQSVCILAKKS